MQIHLNVGSGVDITIQELANTISKVLSYSGVIRFDISKPDGSPRKLMDSDRLISLGWHPNIGLEEGIKKAYASYITLAL